MEREERLHQVIIIIFITIIIFIITIIIIFISIIIIIIAIIIIIIVVSQRSKEKSKRKEKNCRTKSLSLSLSPLLLSLLPLSLSSLLTHSAVKRSPSAKRRTVAPSPAITPAFKFSAILREWPTVNACEYHDEDGDDGAGMMAMMTMMV